MIAVTLIALLALSGCLHKPLTPPTQFSSQITTGGLKLFEMTYPGPKPAIISMRSAKTMNGWSNKRVLASLSDTLEQNHFCRQGYLILGRYAGETTNKIRGECKEPANSDDRQIYPNTIARW